MAINFLRTLSDPARSPSMPFNAAPPAPAMPQFQGDFQRMTQGVAPEPDRVANILQAIGGASESPPVQMPAAEPPRKRRSFLDTIGRISDVIARVGGAEAMYQPTLDAREDRAREIDLDEMRKQLLESQVAAAGQTVQAGEIELADTERARLARALGAVASNPDAVGMWSQIATEAGIDEGRAAQIGAILQNNPQAAGLLAQSLGWTPETKAQGSQAKELQVYKLLMEQGGPELAKSYLQNLVNPDSMSEYQTATLALALERLGLDRDKFEADEERAAAKETAGADLTPTQRGTIKQKLELIPVVRRQYERVRQLYDQMIEEGTFARGGVGGLVPSQLVGGKAEEFDKAVAALRKSILSMTRIPGIGSMSNYETILDQAAIPSRWGSDEGRAESIRNIGDLLDNYESGYRDMLGTTASRPAPRPAPRGRSRSGAAPAPVQRRSVSPAAAEARRRGLID